jgi:hypothetical protein
MFKWAVHFDGQDYNRKHKLNKTGVKQMAKMLYEDKVELMFGGEVGREMVDCGIIGGSAVSNVVEFAGTQPQPEAPDQLPVAG